MRNIAGKALCFFSILLMGLQTQAVTYYSRQDGQYDVASTWSTTSHTGSAASSPPCTCSPCHVGGSKDLEIIHDLSVNCNLTFTGNPSVVIYNGGSLIVTGNANVSGGVVFTIEEGATVNITGNFTLSGGGGAVNVNGNLIIGGNLTITGGFPVCGTGTISIGGNISGAPCSTITLPVTWVSIKALVVDQSVKLNWQTSSEINNDYFSVQHSVDGIRFSSIGIVEGSGNSTTVQTYSYLDEYPSKGLNYYRIAQIDYDGTTNFSEIVFASIRCDDDLIQVVTNGSLTDHVVIIFTGMKNTSSEVSFYDLAGRLIMRRRIYFLADKEHQVFKVPGKYLHQPLLISVHFDNTFFLKKILVGS